jgi:hypothetical protein
MPLIVEHLVEVPSLFQTFLDLLQELISVHQLMVYCRQLGVARHVRMHQGRVMAEDHPEGGFVDGGVKSGVVTELCPWQPL